MATTIDLNSVFTTKIAILISTDDSPQFKQRKTQMLAKMQAQVHPSSFSHIYDKNLASSDSIYQLLET